MIRRAPLEHANHECWLVSYADFITLLFAFFVVMFASTQADKNKAKAVSDSVREALEHGQFSTAISTVLGRGKHEARRSPQSQDPTNQRENTRFPLACSRRTTRPTWPSPSPPFNRDSPRRLQRASCN